LQPRRDRHIFPTTWLTDRIFKEVFIMGRSLRAIMLCLASLAVMATNAFPMEGRLLRHPDIHGNKIVFTYENDLWLLPSEWESARRITSHPGWEGRAKFSPDGTMIGFTANYDGGWDVYSMPAGGGEPVRHTYHPEGSFFIDWSPDGRYLLFRSNREDATGRYQHLYRVPLEGGSPERLPVDAVRYAAYSPDGARLAYNRESSDAMNWKGYKGGAQQDIWITDLKGKYFEKITDWKGYDNFPMWHERGIYFNSDREDGRMNLYLYDPGTKRLVRKTHHTDWDVSEPSLGGDRIVYASGGTLWIFDTRDDSTRKLEIDLPTDRWRVRSDYVDPTASMQSVSLSSKGDSAVVEARGDLYLVDREEEKEVNLTGTPGSREIYPALSPDGKWIAFFSDRSGEYELYIMEPHPGAEWVELTHGSRTYYYAPAWSPDSKKLVYGDKDYNIFTVDTGTRAVRHIERSMYQKDNEIFWQYRDYCWSPDSKWIAYSLVQENLNSSLFLYELASGKSMRLTDAMFDDFSPSFDPSGEHLFFLSLRHFSPLLDPFMDNNVNVDMTGIYLFQLQPGRKPPFEEKWGKGKEKEADAGEKKAEKATTPEIVQDGIGKRLFVVPVEPGTYRDLRAAEGKLYYLSRESFGFPTWEEFVSPESTTEYTIMSYDLVEKETKYILDGIGWYSLSGDAGKVAYRSRSLFGVADAAEGGSVGDGTLSLSSLEQRVDVQEEYRQMFTETWRQLRDFFYDPEMHGRDWEAIRAKYEPLLPYIGNKGDLNYILGEMTGELTASHEYIFGGPSGYEFDAVDVGLLGADLVPDRNADAYQFVHILPGEGWDEELRNPLRRPDIEIAEGFYLFAIDGVRVHANEDYLAHLVGKGGREVTLSVGKSRDPSKAVDYRVKTLTGDRQLRYEEWVQANRTKVEEATGGRVSYMHLADMDERGIQQFERDFRALRYADGLIIDVRENGGGFVSWFLIDKLERKLPYFSATRDFRPMRYPHAVHEGPTVVICNGGTGSDGEIFTQHFKDLGLGRVIGTPTWGGLIGIINMIPLVDGTMVTQPNVGFYSRRGEWIIENDGAQPDILLENDPASVLAGRDPQLEKAIEVITAELEKNPPTEPTRPPYPRK
jgi:tricorn protease